MGERASELRLAASVEGLARKSPEFSARRLVPRRQRFAFAVALVALSCGFAVSTITTLQCLVGFLTVVYLAGTGYRVALFARSARSDRLIRVSDAEALAVPDEHLPVYTVLIPAYRESNVIGLLIDRVGELNYPEDRLDIKVLVEDDDAETIAAIADADPGPQFELVRVPAADPRTKPKALNFGLMLARGELVTVYDVEDAPEPLQLRRAAIALSRLGPEVGCLQARLTYSNAGQNLITKWFMLEYSMWFLLFLPGLVSLRAPVPLGGTSNHFRRNSLLAMGAWDPFNVTEDADLGVRMFRENIEVRILDSETLEEANSDFVNWVKQRSRWYKGYLQTFLIHVRQPGLSIREMGFGGFVQFCLFVGGTPILAVLNPIFWMLTASWFLLHPTVILALFPAPIYYAGLICWAFGNVLIAYMTLITCRAIERFDLLWAALLVPLYWVMMSMAGVKALWQLIVAPNFWEKTTHGLHLHGAAHAGPA